MMAGEICEDCAKPLSIGEVYWYGKHGRGGRCEECESAWSRRMGAWMRGEIIEPELDRIFAGHPGEPE
jgi:hypothetical protein